MKRLIVLAIAVMAATVAVAAPAEARILDDAAAASPPIRVQIPLPVAGDISFAHVVVTARGVPQGSRAAPPMIVLPTKATLNALPGAVAVVAGVVRDPRNRNRFVVDIAVLRANTTDEGSLERADAALGRLMTNVTVEDTDRNDTVDYSGRTAPLGLNVAARAEDGKTTIDAGPGTDTITGGEKWVRTDEWAAGVQIPLNAASVERMLNAVRQLGSGKLQSPFLLNLLGKIDHFGCDVDATSGSISTPGRRADFRVRCSGLSRQKRFSGSAVGGPFFAADVINPDLSLREVLGVPGSGGVAFDLIKDPGSQFIWATDAPPGAKGSVRVEGRGGVRAVYPFTVRSPSPTTLYSCTFGRDTTTLPMPHLKTTCPVPFDHMRVNFGVPVGGALPYGVFDKAGGSPRFGTCQPFGATVVDCTGLNVAPNQFLLISPPAGAGGKFALHLDASDPSVESFRTTFVYGDAQTGFSILDLSHYHPPGSDTSKICGTIKGQAGTVVIVRLVYVAGGQTADGQPRTIPAGGTFPFTATINTPGAYRIEVIVDAAVVAAEPYTVPNPPTQGPRICS